MEEIIQKAIEGGYTDTCHHDEAYSQYKNRLVLDPLFWQALGKVCGWNKGLQTSEVLCGFRRRMINNDTYQALLFHEINLTENWQSAINYLRSVCGVEK